MRCVISARRITIEAMLRGTVRRWGKRRRNAVRPAIPARISASLDPSIAPWRYPATVQDLARHNGINLRLASGGTYAWELLQGD